MKKFNSFIFIVLITIGLSFNRAKAQTAAPYCAFQVLFYGGIYGYDNSLGNNFAITDVSVDGSPALSFTGGTSDAGKDGSTSAAGYNQGVFTSQGATVIQGNSYNWTMARPAGNYACNFRVYVDFNDDNDFNDAGENIISSPKLAKATSSTGPISFTIPADAQVGTHRMRVVCEYNNENHGACGATGITGAQGDAKDFTLTVEAAPSGCPACENPVAPSDITTPLIGKYQARIKWTGDSCVARYRFYYRVAGTNNWTHFIVAPKVARAILTGLTPGTTYEYKIITVCSASPRVWSEPSEIAQFTTNSSSGGSLPTRMEEMNGGLNNNLAVYPNPSNGNINIAFNSSVSEKATLKMFNLLGQQIYSNEVELAEGLNSLNVNLTNQSTGLYTIILQTSSSIYTQKIAVK